METAYGFVNEFYESFEDDIKHLKQILDRMQDYIIKTTLHHVEGYIGTEFQILVYGWLPVTTQPKGSANVLFKEEITWAWISSAI
jgi:hypothetical protein